MSTPSASDEHAAAAALVGLAPLPAVPPAAGASTAPPPPVFDLVCKPKCHFKSCRCNRNIVPLPCLSSKCERVLHWSCFTSQVLHRLSPEVANNITEMLEPGKQVVCTLGCFKKFRQEEKQKEKAQKEAVFGKQTATVTRVAPNWDADGATGANDPNNSISILLLWLSVASNFEKYRGKDNNGMRKIQFAAEVAALINKSGVVVQRTPKHIVNKIDYLIKQYKTALDWTQQTGQGVMEKGDIAGYDNHVRKLCPYWDQLDPILSDRALAQAAASTDSLTSVSEASSSDDSSDGSNDNDDDDELVLPSVGDTEFNINGAGYEHLKPCDDCMDEDDESMGASNILSHQVNRNSSSSSSGNKRQSRKSVASSNGSEKKKVAASVPLSLPSVKKPRTAKAERDAELISGLLGKGKTASLLEDAQKRREKEAGVREKEFKETRRHNREDLEERQRHNREDLEERRRHNLAMEQAAMDTDKLLECYDKFDKIKNKAWATDAAIMTIFPAEIAKQCIAQRKAEQSKPVTHTSDDEDLYN